MAFSHDIAKAIHSDGDLATAAGDAEQAMSDESQPLPTLEYQSNQAQTPPHVICRNCGTRMVQGLVIDIRGHGRLTYYWVAGESKRGWFGTKLPRGKKYEIITFRCASCGLLENYSPAG
jgi:hypothetical protein